MAFIIENIHSPTAGGGHSLVVSRDSATRASSWRRTARRNSTSTRRRRMSF